jgi:signal transduction histidine kinase
VSGRRPASLRVRLALLGLALMAVPVLVLLGVLFSTEAESTRTRTGTTVREVRTSPVSPWVPLTALAMTFPMGLVVWWWAGRAVRPISEITALTDEIQYGSLDRRIALTGGPTEVAALADSFDAMLDRLANASTVQQRLVEDTSHQLRTPLAVLVTNVDLLLSDPGPMSDEHRAGLERTRRAVDRLQATVDDLLATARSDHQRTLQTGNDLAGLVHGVADDLVDVAEARGVAIEVVAPTRVAADLDPAAVRRAVTNLVDNAIRHSPADGTVTIEAGVDGDGDRAFVAVTDQGPGLAPHERDRVFDRYWRGDHGDGGRGIGLSIVQQVADAHGGVDVESPDGGGSRFTLWFRR